MKWVRIKSPSELPKDRIFLGLWKGSYCICEYDEDEQRFYIAFCPAVMTGIMRVDPERLGKFTHYAELELPEDY